MWVFVAGSFLVLALASAWLARLSFASVRTYLDNVAPDGEVETYDGRFHGRVVRDLGRLAWLFAGLSVLSFAVRRSLSGAKGAQVKAMPEFRSGIRNTWYSLFHRSSSTHLRFVLGLIVLGSILRILQLSAPITYDEAFTYVQYASRPFHILLADYSYPNNHILHSLLVKLCTKLFGLHLWSLRLPALIAGILVMPVFYVFVRVMFNRYIALIALGLVASSGALIEYSALARGYSITWLCYVSALLLGRHFAKTNNPVSAVLMALVCAIGMWAVPTKIFAVLAIYIWLVIYLMVKYRHSLNKRFAILGISLGLFVVFTVVFYLPVMTVHGPAQLFHHPTMGDNSWSSFLNTHQERSFDLWAYFNDTSTTWVSLLGVVGLLYAAYISTKFRNLAFALFMGAVPLTTIQCMVGPPRVWTYTLFILHLSSAIALFYLLKFVQEKVYPAFAKRMRTAITTVIVVIGMSFLGMRGIQGRIERFPEAELASTWFNGILHRGDRVLVDFPWEAPVEFHFMAAGLGRGPLFVEPTPGHALYVLVGPGDGQTLELVLTHHRYEGVTEEKLEKVQDWRRLEIYSAK